MMKPPKLIPNCEKMADYNIKKNAIISLISKKYGLMRRKKVQKASIVDQVKS